MHAAVKHYHEAVDEYSKAIELDPSNAVYHSNRSFAHLRLEEYGSAAVDATKAIELDPKYAKVGMLSDRVRATAVAACGRRSGPFGALPEQKGREGSGAPRTMPWSQHVARTGVPLFLPGGCAC